MTTNTDPEAIARRIVEFDARYQTARSLPLGNSERRDAFLSAMKSSIDDAPTLAAAYLDLRAQLDVVTAQRDELREAADAFVDWLPQHTYRPPNDTATRFLAALESAR